MASSGSESHQILLSRAEAEEAALAFAIYYLKRLQGKHTEKATVHLETLKLMHDQCVRDVEREKHPDVLFSVEEDEKTPDCSMVAKCRRVDEAATPPARPLPPVLPPPLQGAPGCHTQGTATRHPTK